MTTYQHLVILENVINYVLQCEISLR